jgi:N-acetyl sugar amidotransferase
LVSFEPTLPTELGKKNLKNLGETFGCDLIQFRKNPLVYKKLGRIAFERLGDHEWPNHIGIFTIPVRVAVNYRIPLIIWGENSQLEYGGPKLATMNSVLNRRWLEEFGGLLGNRIEDMVGVDGLTKRDLLPYFYPSQRELSSLGIHGVFLGYYFKWDAKTQVEIMKKYGFSIKVDGQVEGTYTNYENLDDAIVHIHDYLKFVKYGFGRATDHACIDIRNGRLTRKAAAKLVQEFDGKLHQKPLSMFLKYYGMTRAEFFRIVDSFTNKAIFETDKKGFLKKNKNGELVRKFLP